MEYRMTAPLEADKLKGLQAGDRVLLSGEIFTARDAAHKRMTELLAEGQPLPLVLEGSCIYYAGPTPERPGQVVGAIGPTTAGRMDKYTPALLEKGLLAMIGKGARSEEVIEAIKRTGAVYFGFIGGAGALAAACITACEVVAFEDLGSEAIRRLSVKDFPLVVLVDTKGHNLYKEGREAYLAAQRNE